jgi:serine/threonine protein kinase
MGISTQQLIDSLTSHSILPQKEVTTIRCGLTESQLGVDAEVLVRDLVRTGKITKFQAVNLYQGRGKGLVFGDYVVLDKIGSGGMGKVYKARHRELDRLAALKVLLPHAVSSPRAVKRFFREVEVAVRLQHPNVVAAYGSGEAHGTHYLAMEFVDGPDLSSFVDQNGPPGIADAVSVILQAARGFDYAHRQGIVHRDVKPANLLYDCSKTVKILDLGLARQFEVEGDPSTSGIAQNVLTVEGEIMGTADYMAPEQSQDTHAADARADIYSLGCSLYRILTGNIPYPGETTVMKIMAHHDRPIPSLQAARPDVPAALEAAYQGMMQKKPEERTQTMADVVKAFEAIVA